MARRCPIDFARLPCENYTVRHGFASKPNSRRFWIDQVGCADWASPFARHSFSLAKAKPSVYINGRLMITSKKGAREKGLSEISLTIELRDSVAKAVRKHVQQLPKRSRVMFPFFEKLDYSDSNKRWKGKSTRTSEQRRCDKADRHPPRVESRIQNLTHGVSHVSSSDRLVPYCIDRRATTIPITTPRKTHPVCSITPRRRSGGTRETSTRHVEAKIPGNSFDDFTIMSLGWSCFPK